MKVGGPEVLKCGRAETDIDPLIIAIPLEIVVLPLLILLLITLVLGNVAFGSGIIW